MTDGSAPTRPGRRRLQPTIADVARAAGVSPSAVSFALNGRPGLAASTRAHILRTVDQLGWRPSNRGRALARDHAEAIGLVIARSPVLLGGDPFFAQLLSGVESVLSAHDYALVLRFITGGQAAELAAYRRLLRTGRVDGVLLTDVRRKDSRIPALLELGMPTVIAGEPRESAAFPSVELDAVAGTAAAANHLLELGHRRIAYVTGPLVYEHARRRCNAWSTALRRAGVTERQEAKGDFTGAGGARATEHLLAQTPRPTAIMYANDLMAVAGLGVAAECGLRVPRDLSVVGFDDIAVASYTNPPLTTVRQDAPALGGAAAAMLLSTVIGTEVAFDPVPVPELMVRSSTAPPPA